MTEEQDAVAMAKIEQHMPEILYQVKQTENGIKTPVSLPDETVSKHIIAVLTEVIDNLAGACLDEKGQPKTPDRQALMRARGHLPAYCKNTLIKEKP